MTPFPIHEPPASATFAIIPVKPLRQAKSRLARAIRAPLRAALIRSILSRTIDLLTQSDRIAETIVVSSDVTALDLARSKHTTGLVESETGLNPAVAQAVTWAVKHGASSVLIVPADLPLLTESDIEAMVDLAFEPRCMVIAPDRHNQGTNLMLLRPPDAIAFAYGPASFETHRRYAAEARLAVHISPSPTPALRLHAPDPLPIHRDGPALLAARSLSE